MKSTLANAAESIVYVSTFAQYSVIGGVLITLLVLLCLRISFEMIWSLVNTLQLLSYLPLMIIYYPDHVKVMFKLLQFTNIDFKLLADFFRNLVPADLINTPSFNVRFYNFGVQTTLFLDNCASLIMSFALSMLILLICLILYKVIWCEKLKSFFSDVVSAYFFNNFLRFVAEGYLDLSFGAFLNVISFNISTTSEIASLTIAALIAII